MTGLLRRVRLLRITDGSIAPKSSCVSCLFRARRVNVRRYLYFFLVFFFFLVLVFLFFVLLLFFPFFLFFLFFVVIFHGFWVFCFAKWFAG